MTNKPPTVRDFGTMLSTGSLGTPPFREYVVAWEQDGDEDQTQFFPQGNTRNIPKEALSLLLLGPPRPHIITCWYYPKTLGMSPEAVKRFSKPTVEWRAFITEDVTVTEALLQGGAHRHAVRSWKLALKRWDKEQQRATNRMVH